MPVEVTEEGGAVRATLTSVEPHIEEIADADLAEALAALGWLYHRSRPGLPAPYRVRRLPAISFSRRRHVLASQTSRTTSHASKP